MSRVTVAVYRPDLSDSDAELVYRLQALAELELDRVRARYHDHELVMIEIALVDGLSRVTASAARRDPHRRTHHHTPPPDPPTSPLRSREPVAARSLLPTFDCSFRG